MKYISVTPESKTTLTLAKVSFETIDMFVSSIILPPATTTMRALSTIVSKPFTKIVSSKGDEKEIVSDHSNKSLVTDCPGREESQKTNDALDISAGLMNVLVQLPDELVKLLDHDPLEVSESENVVETVTFPVVSLVRA